MIRACVQQQPATYNLPAHLVGIQIPGLAGLGLGSGKKVYLAACAVCCQGEGVGVTAHNGLHLLPVRAEDCDVVLVVLALPTAGALHYARQACMVRLQSACAVRSGVNICNCLLTCSGQQ